MSALKNGKSLANGNGMDNPWKRMFNFEETAYYLGISAKTIRNKRSDGTFPIPAKKVCGRVLWDKKDIDRYLDKLNHN